MQKRLTTLCGVPLRPRAGGHLCKDGRADLPVEPKWRQVLLLRKKPHHRPPSRA